MATYRIGIGSFNLKDGAVGIGTESSGLGNLKVEGTYKTEDLDVLGVSTFTRYAGFAADDVNIIRDTSLSGEHSTQGDIVVGINSIFTVSTGATVTVGTVESVSIGTHFSPPTGGVEERPEVPVEGTVRFNTDLNTLEFYNGFEWKQFTVSGASGRMVIWDGRLPNSNTKTIEYVNIHTKGNAFDFGSALDTAGYVGGVSNSIRGVFAGRTSPSESVEYVTLASQGNATDFGDLTGSREQLSGVSNSTRGIFCGGMTPTHLNTMEYIQIMTTGNAIDFGDLTQITIGPGTVSDGTRGIIAEADQPIGRVSQITIASTGNAVDVGSDSLGGTNKAGGASSGTRGLWAGGYTGGPGSMANIVTSSVRGVTISSAGNATEFGNLTKNRAFTGGSGSQTRGVWCSGRSGDGWENIIDYVSIHSGGQAEDFGDLMNALTGAYPVSDCHGGLGGY